MADPQATHELDLTRIDAALFDMDGVITKTMRVHRAAWAALFDEFLRRRAAARGEPFVPFDPERDYLEYVDGKPRYEGVRSFLASRGIELPSGRPDDPPDAETICGLGNRKNGYFRQRLERDGVEVYEAAVAFARALRVRGVRLAVVTSSKNCTLVLERAGLAGLFDAQVDGVVIEELGLTGKPDPDMFVEAARRLGAAPDRTAVFEDAISGVDAGRRGGFGLVVGIDRAHQADGLRAHGADIVIRSFTELQIDGSGAP